MLIPSPLQGREWGGGTNRQINSFSVCVSATVARSLPLSHTCFAYLFCQLVNGQKRRSQWDDNGTWYSLQHSIDLFLSTWATQDVAILLQWLSLYAHTHTHTDSLPTLTFFGCGLGACSSYKGCQRREETDGQRSRQRSRQKDNKGKWEWERKVGRVVDRQKKRQCDRRGTDKETVRQTEAQRV